MPGSIDKKRRLIRACASMQLNKNACIYPNQINGTTWWKNGDVSLFRRHQLASIQILTELKVATVGEFGT